MAGLAYAHYFVDIPLVLKQDVVLGSMIGEGGAQCWGDRIEYAVKVCWMFGAIAHLAEAVYVAYICKTCLKMRFQNMLSWFVMVVLVGYPMTSKVLHLKNVQQKEQERGDARVGDSRKKK